MRDTLLRTSMSVAAAAARGRCGHTHISDCCENALTTGPQRQTCNVPALSATTQLSSLSLSTTRITDGAALPSSFTSSAAITVGFPAVGTAASSRCCSCRILSGTRVPAHFRTFHGQCGFLKETAGR